MQSCVTQYTTDNVCEDFLTYRNSPANFLNLWECGTICVMLHQDFSQWINTRFDEDHLTHSECVLKLIYIKNSHLNNVQEDLCIHGISMHGFTYPQSENIKNIQRN